MTSLGACLPSYVDYFYLLAYQPICLHVSLPPGLSVFPFWLFNWLDTTCMNHPNDRKMDWLDAWWQVSWLPRWLVDILMGLLASHLTTWLAAWLAAWLAHWLANTVTGWLPDWWASCLVGCMVGCLISHIACCLFAGFCQIGCLAAWLAPGWLTSSVPNRLVGRTVGSLTSKLEP